MRLERFQEITGKYSRLRVAIAGDFCLDRYLEIDPKLNETSIETGLTVHNVVRVRSQPGGAGTILNNLVALGIGTIYPIGFCGEDGEGFELTCALQAKPGVKMDCFIRTPQRRTFTYCKPLVVESGKSPVELNRLDSKNWTPTPHEVQQLTVQALDQVATQIDALILLDQVDLAETGVVTQGLLQRVATLRRERCELLIIADSRRGLVDFPPVTFKMNRAEFSRLTDSPTTADIATMKCAAAQLAARNGRSVFISLAEQGILGASPNGEAEHVHTLPTRGEIDIVGAGDAVTANLAASLAAGADLREALMLANAAASIVIHQLGTTGEATTGEIRQRMTNDQ